MKSGSDAVLVLKSPHSIRSPEYLQISLIRAFISPLDDYKIFHTHRVQNNRANRKFGGISVLIRKSLSDGVEPLLVTNSRIV
jgi:hypothetical protein